MKVIILSWGLGKRLDSPLHAPKALTLLADGRSILELQLDALSQYVSLDLVTVLVGYQFDCILKQFPNLSYLYNPDFAKENTAGSLRKALRKVDEDLLFMNGDVVFHPTILKRLLNFGQTAMLVNSGEVGEEEVKYRTDQYGKILEVSKEVQDAQGEALGINFLARKI